MLQLIKQERSRAAFARRVGTDPAYVSQIFSDKTRAEIGDTLSRNIEKAYGLEHGWMDNIHEMPHAVEMTTFAERVKEERKKAGLNQQQLAKVSGLSQTTISDIERSRNESSRDLVTLAHALNVSAEWLITGLGDKQIDAKAYVSEAAPGAPSSCTELTERIQSVLNSLRWGWADLARAMGLAEQRVNNWRTRGIPARELRSVETALKLPRYTLDIAEEDLDEFLDVVSIRRKRLKQVIDEKFSGKQTRLVEATGINAGELSALMRDKPFGEKKARSLEKQAGLPGGYLDRPFDQKREQSAKPLGNAKEKRFQNLRWLISTRFGGNAGQCADFLGMKRPQMSRWVTDNEVTRQGVSEESAREIERKLGLPRGSLDGDEDSETRALGIDDSELLEAWAYLLPAEKDAIMEQIRPMAAHNKAVLEKIQKP